MSYVASQLLPGEKVRYRAHLSKLLFLPAIALGVLALGAGVLSALGTNLWWVAGVLAGATFLVYVWELVLYTTSEFAVTDRRVIIKVGWIKRRTLETMLGKLEALGVEQGLLGRVLGFGTITVTGTGGTRETFDRIGDPLEFRKQVQAAAMAADEQRVLSGAPLAAGAGAGQMAREERECPFCAERVLVKARICRFCNRELPPVAAE